MGGLGVVFRALVFASLRIVVAILVLTIGTYLYLSSGPVQGQVEHMRAKLREIARALDHYG